MARASTRRDGCQRILSSYSAPVSAASIVARPNFRASDVVAPPDAEIVAEYDTAVVLEFLALYRLAGTC